MRNQSHPPKFMLFSRLSALGLVVLAGLIAVVISGSPGSESFAAMQASPTPGFGPIVGPDYTPVPLYTPLPAVLSVQPCYGTISVGEILLYQEPNSASPVRGSVLAGEQVRIDRIMRDQAGVRWAGTENGWFALENGDRRTANLDAVRYCQVLMGEAPNTTLMGLHVLNQYGYNATLDFVARMAAAGIPVGTVKGLDGTEDILKDVKAISPQTVTVYRALINPDGYGDCPGNVRERPDPAATARRWVNGQERQWKLVNADYYELVNECPVRLDWLVQFSIESMKVAQENGRCLLVLSLGVGSPEESRFNELIPLVEYILNNPCQPGRLHGIALHTYSMDDSVMISSAPVQLARRHALIYDKLRESVPNVDQVPLYLTEVGIGWGSVVPPCDWLARDMVRYTYQLEGDPYVKGFHLWNIGPNKVLFDVGPCLPQIADALIAYYQTGIAP